MKKTVLLDTNIFIRFFTADIHKQYKLAKDTFQAIEHGNLTGLVSILVVNEIVWIMEHFYDVSRKRYIPGLLELLALKNIKILEMKKTSLFDILMRMEKESLDFTDLYLLQHKDRHKIISFDKDLA